MAQVQIENFQWSDIEVIVQLEKRTFPQDAFSRATFSALFRRGRDSFLIARTYETIIGYIAGLMVDHEGYIASIAVDPDARRLGVGTALIRRLTDIFHAKGAVAMTLHVRIGNQPAIALYQKLGFVIAETIAGYYDDEAGLFMRLALAASTA